jgi:hypothetical protein
VAVFYREGDHKLIFFFRFSVLKTGILGAVITVSDDSISRTKDFKMLDSESRYNVETALTAKEPPFLSQTALK